MQMVRSDQLQRSRSRCPRLVCIVSYIFSSYIFAARNLGKMIRPTPKYPIVSHLFKKFDTHGWMVAQTRGSGLRHQGLQCTTPRYNVRLTSSKAARADPLEDRSKGISPTATKNSVTGYPLSVLPTPMLLRSLLVSTISSHRFLLLPCLSFLQFLLKNNRNILFDVERNPLLYWTLKKTFYNQFCAGETENETRACAQRFKDLGFRGVIITYAKETVFDHKTKTFHGTGISTSESLGADTKGRLLNADIDNWKLGCLASGHMVGSGDLLAIKYECMQSQIFFYRH